jgi:hypothetical protein
MLTYPPDGPAWLQVVMCRMSRHIMLCTRSLHLFTYVRNIQYARTRRNPIMKGECSNHHAHNPSAQTLSLCQPSHNKQLLHLQRRADTSRMHNSAAAEV